VYPFGEAADDLPPDFQQLYNRDYHAIITNERLAAVFETHIDRDAELTSAAGAMEPFALPDLFVTESAPVEIVQFDEPPQFFPPLRLARRVRVQPLLTPDNYAEHTLALIRSATDSVWFQNQYINFRNTGEDFPEFQMLVEALRAKIAEGLDVRIICRDYMKQESVDILLALGFPREAIRFQLCCHNKMLVVDRKMAMFGSHNWSNEGVSTNRDASLVFFDEEIADYLARIYEYDWEKLARTTLMPVWPRVAPPGESTPPGCVRVPYTTVFPD
jgi:phosphatidylserine/phosphatidylglycerophosphate/cardiolipin synthase-like enzyme